jgi:N-acetyl sugar amidotransferase
MSEHGDFIMKYCRRCVYPEMKPDLRFDGTGLCSACQNYDRRAGVDWAARQAEFVATVEASWPHKGTPLVLVPVSGGKDSTAQVVKCQELGFRVLAVNARTDLLTPLGRENLDNIGRMCDLVEFHPNDVIRRKIMRLALKEVGDWSWPEHVLIHTVPFQAAIKWKIPTIVYGELSQDEYGAGPLGSEDLQRMTRRYVEEFAGLLGLRVDDVQSMLGLSRDDMMMYTFPTSDDIKDAGVQALWLGRYFPWDGYDNFMVAKRNGFKSFIGHVDGSLYGYENLDNYCTGARDYLRWLKYGYGRATDIACNHVRRGRLSREEAVSLIKERDGAFPHAYLGRSLAWIVGEIGLTLDDFMDAADRFMNKDLFSRSLSSPRPVPLFEVA